MISITRDVIDTGAMIEAAKRPGMGALVTFCGVVRDDGGVERMELEAYEDVAVRELEAIRDTAMRDYAIESVDIVHRVGSLLVGETILLVIVGAGHRKEAFAASEYIIDRLKQTVPIWKKEFYREGERWVQGEAPGR
ncbi:MULTISPECIES: molybdenum cofactor biosynthesis protein MoaE [unclassified Methanoculleus]|jgi:molybdopterin synthase catalytic subunit|uniref:Molybdenum cofactor biosynthesis protein MoaE n=1 Tax=Methanoculleus palmolei TaxID=72612 RepID=A0ABD8A6G4_9EURY|nr:molybdenum cofactor biosynthesis protein MoaE [Methanoculleus sp. UBA377]MDD2473170.1 molybdenum cofactor biosynthesis protein MoaE [Methanoculleus sp.]WOX55133.1 molybdenum cofactor biosynthesis protein MoaE [Methanoculleus palmolei]